MSIQLSEIAKSRIRKAIKHGASKADIRRQTRMSWPELRRKMPDLPETIPAHPFLADFDDTP